MGRGVFILQKVGLGVFREKASAWLFFYANVLNKLFEANFSFFIKEE